MAQTLGENQNHEGAFSSPRIATVASHAQSELLACRSVTREARYDPGSPALPMGEVPRAQKMLGFVEHSLVDDVCTCNLWRRCCSTLNSPWASVLPVSGLPLLQN